MAELRRKAHRRRAAATPRRRGRRTAAARSNGLWPRLGGWLNRLLIVAGLCAVGLAATRAWLALAAIPVERVVISGNLQRTQIAAVEEVVQPALAGGFLNADLGAVRGELEALPWIYRATVRRRWPNALEVAVVEQLPIARWGKGGFLNHEGEVFESRRARELGSDLPRLEGPPGSARELIVSFQQLGEWLQPLELELAALRRDERGHLTAELANGVRLVLGDRELRARLSRFARVWRAELSVDPARVEQVDLRYSQGLAVAFRAPPAEVAGGLAQLGSAQQTTTHMTGGE